MAHPSAISIALTTRLKSGASWNALGAVFTQGSTLLVNVVLANILGRSAFGEFGMIYSTATSLAGIAQLGTGLMATRYVAEFRETDKCRTGRILGFCRLLTAATGVLAAIGLGICAPWLSERMMNEPSLAHGIAMSAVFVLFSVMNGYQIGALAGLEGYRSIAFVGIAQGFVHLIFVVGCTWMFSLLGTIAGMTLSAIARWSMFALAISFEAKERGISIQMSGASAERDLFFKFGLPAALSGFSTLPSIWLANTFLARQHQGFYELGLFSAANNLRIIVLFLPVLLNSVGTSLLNSHRALYEAAQYRKLYDTNMKLTAAIASLGAIFFALTGPWVMKLFGAEFGDGHLVIIILMTAAVFEAIAMAAYQVVQTHQKMWFSLGFIALPRDILLVALAYSLTATHGALGLASAFALTWTFAFVVIALAARRIGVNYLRGTDSDRTP